ncbi:MAG: hypothetical protein HY457_00865 [Parcubacteria group bacterium]|nr:hypothetical protein [Parcubacteria group bacterium]
MSEYALNVGPYFFGALGIAFALAVASAWWNRSLLLKVAAFAASVAMVYLVFTAVGVMNERIDYVVNNLLSRPKVVTFEALQDMLPKGHPGHLVLYGEIKSDVGIYLLLRSPTIAEPRYYLLLADEKTQQQFQEARREAQEKRTQLLLGGKPKEEGLGDGNEGAADEENRDDADDAEGGGEVMEGENVFHPAPVAGGPEKTSRPQDQPLILGMPGANAP